MVQTQQQFTPEQILEAGRRAEEQGQNDYALQFYRHVVEHHAASPQAAAAREALQRLGAAGPPAAHRNGFAGRPADVNARDLPARREPLSSEAPPRASAEKRPPPSGRRVSDIVPPRGDLELPPVARGFLAGRVVAWLFVGLGGLFAILGAAVAVLGMVTGVVPLLPAVAPPAVLGGSLLAIGLVLLFVGQTALAVFASALASRDTAQVMRAIADDLARRRW
jgi:hypothetical protein